MPGRCLEKPFNGPELMDALRSHLGPRD